LQRKKVKAQIIIGIIFLLFATRSQTIAQSTAYANIYAEVVAPVGIRNTSELHSGEIVISNKNMVALISNGNPIPGSESGSEPNLSVILNAFSITDASLSTFSITLPQENINIGNSISNSLIISNFTSNQTQTGSRQGDKIGIIIAATLNMTENRTICNNQAKHPFPVTFNYN